MPKSRCLTLDTKDDRREMHQLLERLPPAARLRWLQWCCDSVPGPHRGKVKVNRFTTGENALEVFLDAWQLFVQYELDPTAAAEQLESLVSRALGVACSPRLVQAGFAGF